MFDTLNGNQFNPSRGLYASIFLFFIVLLKERVFKENIFSSFFLGGETICQNSAEQGSHLPDPYI